MTVTSEANERLAALVLVVEDEPIQRMALVDAIEEAGFAVVEARDAGIALMLLEARTDIRLVVTDVEMPGPMDGLKLAEMVRDRWPPIEMVIVSAGAPPAPDDLPARVEFVPKPILTDRLIAKLKRLIGNS